MIAPPSPTASPIATGHAGCIMTTRTSSERGAPSATRTANSRARSATAKATMP